MADKNFKYIVRIANTDLDGNKAIYPALRKIRGVGFAFSNAVCRLSNVDPGKKVGNLSDDEVKKIDIILKDLSGIPRWLYNRRKDYDNGSDKHLLTSTLKLTKEFDIKRLQKIKSYRGMRHAFGLPVRGQRTKGHFRKGRSVGVQKKKIKEAQKGKKEKK